MIGSDKEREEPATVLCKSCGLCCSGHLFAWVKLRSREVEPAKSMGLNVLGTAPKNRGFNQPCPLWNGQCTIYASPDYPRSCRTYKCKLLKRVLEESTSLPEAIDVVQHAKALIKSVDGFLPVSANCNFRERLVAHLESEDANSDFQEKAGELLTFYKNEFGVKDFFLNSEEI